MVFTGAYRVVTNDGMWVYTLPFNWKEEQHTNHHVIQPRIDTFPTRKAHRASSSGGGEIEEVNQLPVNWCISLLALRKHAFERYILSSIISSIILISSVFAYPRPSIVNIYYSPIILGGLSWFTASVSTFSGQLLSLLGINSQKFHEPSLHVHFIIANTNSEA